MNKSGYGSREIAEALGRNKSTVCYELSKRSCGADGYRPDKAEASALSLRRGKRKSIIEEDNNLRSAIVEGLQNDLSPDVIANRRRLEGLPTVCSETIYQFIYNSKLAEEQNLYLCLARKRQNRLKRGSQARIKRHSIPDRVSITERDAISKSKTQLGHLDTAIKLRKREFKKKI